MSGAAERDDALLAAARELGARARAAGRIEEVVEVLRAGAEAVLEGEPERGALPARHHGMFGESEPMRKLFGMLEKVAPTDVPVLILGETGTGKELIARAVHAASGRAKGPFVAVNCAAVPAGLLESELFGHKRGAFTGAVADRQGQFAAADKGTLLLDEIGDMPLAMQSKLLRVLQEGEVRRVGDNKVTRVDVRVLAASHRDLAAMCASGDFREDLFYRLCVVQLQAPPLRERGDDTVALARGLFAEAAAEAGRPGLELAPEALAVIREAPWPGNVRQLINELRRAIALSPPDARSLGVDALSGELREASAE